MKNLIINGMDRTADLGVALAASARTRPPAGLDVIQAAFSARHLQQSTDEATYLDELILQLRHANVVKLEPFRVPRRPGRAGALLAAFKTHLWKLLRYQHEHVTAQQNSINQFLVAALEFEHRARQRDVAALQQRITDLERKLGAK
jgi:hypothetical protein